MSDPLLQIAAYTAAALTLLGVLRGGYLLIKRLDRVIGVDKEGKTVTDRMEKRIEDVASKLDAHADEVTDRLAKVEYHMFPNGGGSLVDKVNKVDRQLAEVKAQQDIVLDLLNTIVDAKGR